MQNSRPVRWASTQRSRGRCDRRVREFPPHPVIESRLRTILTVASHWAARQFTGIIYGLMNDAACKAVRSGVELHTSPASKGGQRDSKGEAVGAES